jgi:hypothetical protein
MQLIASVYGSGIPQDDAEGRVFDPEPVCILSDEHAASNYGLPVLLIDGVPHSRAEADRRGIHVHPEATLGVRYNHTGHPPGSNGARAVIAEWRKFVARWMEA